MWWDDESICKTNSENNNNKKNENGNDESTKLFAVVFDMIRYYKGFWKFVSEP